MLYLGQGFFEVLIAAQAPPHRTPSKVRNPTFPQGIPEIRHRNLSCLQRGTEGQRRYIAVDMQVFDCIGLFVGPFSVHDFASCYFYQVFAVLPRRFHTDGGGKSSRFSTFSKASEQSQESNVSTRNSRNPRTGTFLASNGEPKASGDTSQWTCRFSIASDYSWAPSASTILPLAISTRSSLSSRGDFTQMVAEKVHAFPLSRKLLRFPISHGSKETFCVPGIRSLLVVKRYISSTAARTASS